MIGFSRDDQRGAHVRNGDFISTGRVERIPLLDAQLVDPVQMSRMDPSRQTRGREQRLQDIQIYPHACHAAAGRDR